MRFGNVRIWKPECGSHLYNGGRWCFVLITPLTSIRPALDLFVEILLSLSHVFRSKYRNVIFAGPTLRKVIFHKHTIKTNGKRGLYISKNARIRTVTISHTLH